MAGSPGANLLRLSVLALQWLRFAASFVLNARHPTCLSFMHVPRTGGTSVDSLNLHLPKHLRFRSFMVEAFEMAAADDSTNNSVVAPGDLFDTTHKDHDTYLAWMEQHRRKYLPYVDLPGSQECTVHTPPAVDAKSQAFYTEDGCTTFCVVRDPLERFLSTYSFGHGPCKAGRPAFSRYAMETFDILKYKPWYSLCHFVPQTKMIFGTKRERFCHRILRYENLTAEFDALMAETGRSEVKLQKRLFGTGGTCSKMDKRLVPKEVRDKVYEYYKADYDAFGFPRP